MHTGCEVCGDRASVTTSGMCLCAPCAGVSEHVTKGVWGDAFIKTMDPFGLRHHLPIDTEQAAAQYVKKPLTEAADTLKVVFIAGSVAVIGLVAYALLKPTPRGQYA